MSSIKSILSIHYPGRWREPASIDDLHDKDYMVYILERNDEAIVVGHGRKNRAKVIFDDLHRTTNGHIKAIFVRLYHIYADKHTQFFRYVVTCSSKKDAQKVEAHLHTVIKGNHRKLPSDIEGAIFKGLPANGVEIILLKIALASSFDGLSDLKMWRRKGIIDDYAWKIISKRLQNRVSQSLTPDIVESEINKINESIYDWMQSKQTVLAPSKILPEWPEVILSEDDPPIFKNNKHLKKIYEEDEAEGVLECAPDFEELLGCYIPSEQTIILWIKGIELCSKRLFAGCDENGQTMIGIPIGNLLKCVYVHELGHWFNHVAHTGNDITWDSRNISVMPSPGQDEEFGYSPKKDSSLPERPNGVQIHELLHYLHFPVDGKSELKINSFGDAYSCSSRSYHEVWAQWFAWLYGCEKDSGALEAFEVLERLQSRPYKAWRKLVDSALSPDRGLFEQKSYALSDLRYTQERILGSLEWSRSHGIPVTFDDANHKATNMLLWLKSIPKVM